MRASHRALVFLLALAVTCWATAEDEEDGDMLARVPTGEFWYAMMQGEQPPCGYARLVVARGRDGGLHVDWELRLAQEDGTYEEARTMALDAQGRLVESAYRVFGNLVCAGRRDATGWVVSEVQDGKVHERPGEVPGDARTGMGFVLASAVPRHEGGHVSYPEVDEANGFAPLGESVLRWVRHATQVWEGQERTVHEVDVRRGNGSALPTAVLDDGRILEIDWGGGMRMRLSSRSTKDLFRPPSPVLDVVEDGERLRMRGDLVAFSPEEVYDHFTTPALLTTFWPPVADVEARAGGRYHLDWPGPGWRLRGTVRAAERGRRLAFTWRWEHAPDAPELLVTLELAPREGGGTRITLTQGTYRDRPEDAKEREGHVRGWQQVFGRLRGLR